MALIFDTVRTESSHIHGSTNNARFMANDWGLKLQNDNGYIHFGPANTSHAHIYTDRSDFYFNKQIQLLGGTLINQNDIQANIFYDKNNTSYYLDPATTGDAFYTQGRIRQLNQQNSTWPYLFTTTTASNTNSSGFWVGSNGYPDMRLRRENSTVRALISSWERSYTSFGFTDSTDVRSPIFYDNNNTAYYIHADGGSNLNVINANTISISGNSNLGNGNGDVTRINDVLHVGASDSGNASIIFGEDSSSWYGAHLYWDSGYRFTWYTRNAGTDTTLFYYDTNDLSYINWGRHHHIQNKDINYVNQLHFNDNVRFYDDGNDSYLNFKFGDAATGGIKFLNGSAAQQGFLYASASGFGLLSADGTWAVQTLNNATTIHHSARSPIFYDSDNTAYYVDPASTSNMLNINMNNGTLSNVNHITINDPGVGEGIQWNGGNGWQIYESADSNNNGSGNLQFATGTTHRFRVDTNGNTFSLGSSRAPVFYDYNDTAYYIDGASTSSLNNLRVNTVNGQDTWEGTITINGDAATYYPVGWYGGSQAEVCEIEIFRNYSETAPSSWNTSTHKGGLICKLRANWGGWGGVQYDWVLEDFRETYSTMVAWAGHFANSRAFGLKLRGGGAIYHVRIKGRSVAPTVTLGTWDPGNNSTGISETTTVDSVLLGRRNHIRGNYLYSYDSQVLHSGSTAQTKTGTLQSDVDFRAPLFYDSNDTNYYIDAGSTGTSIKVRGTIENPSIWINDGDNYNGYNENIRLFNPANGVSVIAFAASGTSGTPTSSILGYSDRHEVRRGSNWETRTYDGYQVARGSYRAPIFYDSDNTGYYINPAGVSNINELHGSGKEIFDATDDSYLRINQSASFSSGCWFGNSNRLSGDTYIAAGGNGGTTSSRVYIYGGAYTGTNVIKIDGNSGIIQTTTDSVRAPRFYDYDNTSYYLDAASTSRLNQTTTNYVNVAANNAYALRLWNGSHNYSIRMSTSGDSTYGGRVAGETTSDYNMYFTMAAGTNRGFVFRSSNSASSCVAGIDALGNARFTGFVETPFINVEHTATYGNGMDLTFSGTFNSGLLIRNNTGLTRSAVIFYYSYAANPSVGSINVSSTSTSYNTSSDYRLKENLAPITDGIERVKLLQPKRFNFIIDPEKTVDGFLAHEAQEVVPEAVSGEKDGVDHEGNPEYQGIDQAKLVPLLTAALQEAIAKIEDLESRLQAIENR